MKRYLFPLLLLLTFLLIGCPAPYDGLILDGNRTFMVDVRNSLFNSPTEADPGLRGLGAESVLIFVDTEDAKGNISIFNGSLSASDIDTTWDYTRVPIDISGTLVAVHAQAVSFVSDLTELEEGSPLLEYTVFENTEKVKIDYLLNEERPSTSILRLLVCPRGGNTPIVRIDSGVVDNPPVSGQTDRAAELLSKQVAFSVEPAEHPEDLSFDVYYAVVAANLAVDFNPDLTFEANYEPHPWTDRWTLGEITVNGKQIGENVYYLAQYNTLPLDITNPMAADKTSAVIDLSASADADITNKYLLLAIVLRYGSLRVPLDIRCIDIN